MQLKYIFQRIGQFIFLVFLVNLVGYIGSSYMTADTMVWYHQLPASFLTPPDYIFGIVWSFLLFLQAIAAFLVWGRATPRYFVLQLALNMLWSFSFFGLRNPTAALVVVIFFILALIMNIRTFGRELKVAGWLIIPTLLWALFALYLNSVVVFS
ncbi:MAG: tryptophan-rich sensory protein [Alphaproteobacteria bacterium]|nr:tryptophan-rich sensory protein [Alphaproteobacteria bacterium]MBQ4471889.1 tryptophan-rich sensory protein [Alphaproteobacteria bacterium]